MSEKPPHLMFVAGEASGDMHAAHVIKELKKQNNSLTFSGLGGKHMAEQGVELFEDMTQLALIGFWEVLKHYGQIKRIFDQFLREVTLRNPDAVILVDYPGFNLRLAKALKQRHIKVIYYISPQVWAWKENRIQNIKKTVDRMLVIFPFEKEYYTKHRIDVDFVGHPLIDTVKTTLSREDVLRAAEFNLENRTIGILPGSRQKEIERILPTMLDTARLLHQRHNNLQFFLIKASTVDKKTLLGYIKKYKLAIKIITNNAYDHINACDLCLVTSGTATLETALLNKPMIVIYKTSWLTYFLAKFFITIPHISLVNIIAKKAVVPECIQNKASKEAISETAEQLISSPNRLKNMSCELKKIKNLLGNEIASHKTAAAILASIKTDAP